MALSWLAVNAQTGVILAEFPDLVAQGPCAVTMGRYETLNVSIPYPASVIAYANDPENNDAIAAVQDLADFKTATRPGFAVIIAVDESDSPIWGGLVLTRNRDQTSSVQLSTVTLESYLDRRYVGTYAGTGVDQNQVCADLIDQFIQDGTLPGLPIRIANTASATTQTVAYADDQDMTVYGALNNLAGTVGGPQWTIGWERQAGPERVTPVIFIADRLGSPTPTGLAAPNNLFNMPGCVESFALVEDYSTGKGANIITAVDSGQGNGRIQDTETVDDFAGRIAFEFRYTPTASSSSIQLTPAQHAIAALAATRDGAQVITVTARVFDDDGVTRLAPELGTDWKVGADVAYDITAPGFIDGELTNRVGQCLAWQRDDDRVYSVLATQDVGTT